MSDREAYSLATRVSPELTERERQYALTVARSETFFGKGWKIPEAKDSHNWGAIQGSGDAGSFSHKDSHEDGTPYIGVFRKYSSDDAGWRDLVRILLKPNVREALVSGNGLLAAQRQRENHYYELPLGQYQAALRRNYEAMMLNLDVPKVLSFDPLAPPFPHSPPGPEDSSGASDSSVSPVTSFGAPSELPILRVGSHGNGVFVFFLLAMQYRTRFYTRELADRVRTFQASCHLKPDGVVGSKTWAALLSRI